LIARAGREQAREQAKLLYDVSEGEDEVEDE
jgi:hypothetical protein